MQIDIANHIEKLLFLHDALTIPSFGAFSARPSSASADYAGGTVAPPSKTLTFNENITTDDGLLVQDVAKMNGVSSEKARQAVQEFVENIQEMLNRREIVTLPGIGRLYKNYVQKIQFLPDATNFNAESFGLPPLQFSPIARSREVTDTPTTGNVPQPPSSGQSASSIKTSVNESAGKAASSAAVRSEPVPASTGSAVPSIPQPERTESSSRSGSSVVPMLVTLLLLLCAMAGYWVWKQNRSIEKIAGSTEKKEQTATKNEQDKQPTSTKNKQPERTTPPPKAAAPEKTAEKDPDAAVAEKMEAARQEIKSGGTGKRECILVVATLQEEVNANRLVGMLESEGYQVYFLRQRGFQVGIQFRYDHLSQVQEKMLALQKLTGEQNIWIKKR